MASSSLANNFVVCNYSSLGLSIVGYLIPVWVLAIVCYVISCRITFVVEFKS